MWEYGYNRTFEQCREKVKKLEKEYRKINSMRDKEVQCSYVFLFHDRVLGHKSSTVPESVVDSLALARREKILRKIPVENQRHPKLMK